MQILFQAIVILLKIVVPGSMLLFPFFGMWANYALDVVDGDILLSLGMSDYTYQTIDKVADLVSYVFMLVLGLRFRIRKTIVVLFVYRFIGQVLFFITRDEIMFVYFQNFLEPLLMIYTLLLVRIKSEEKTYKVYMKYLIPIWLIILGYKIWNEWYLHYANFDLSKLLFGFTGGE